MVVWLACGGVVGGAVFGFGGVNDVLAIFGNGNALRFRSSSDGTLAPSAEPGLRHGAAAWVIDGGAGAFEGATGRIVSNFLLSETGDLTDNQLGVLFLPGGETPRAAPC